MRWAVWPVQSRWLLLQVPVVCPKDGDEDRNFIKKYQQTQSNNCSLTEIRRLKETWCLLQTNNYHNIFCDLYFHLDFLQRFIVLTYPDQNLEGVDSIIYSPLNVIHQVVSGASDHHCWDGTILLLCLKQSGPHDMLSLKLIAANIRFKMKTRMTGAKSDLPCLKTTTWVSPTSVRYTPSQWPISSGVGAV